MPVVLITGCSSGFGRAAAAMFADEGYDVVATMRDPSRAGDLVAGHPGLVVDRLDVTDPSARREVVDRTLERFGRIDVLVNNAGITALGPAEEMPEETIRQLFETNVFGPFGLIRDVLPSMVEHHTGRIVNVTSIGALLASGFYSVYCATKHALDALSLGLDIELQAFGIRVVTVVPGGYSTGIEANRIRVTRPDTRYARAEPAIEAFAQRLVGKVDLTPVVAAIKEAATAPEPAARYLVGEGTARLLVPLIEEGERIHQVLRARDAP